MHYNVFTSHRLTFAILLTLTIALIGGIAPIHRVSAADEYLVYLPLTLGSPADTQPPPPIGAPEEIVRDRINFYRTLAGAPQLQLHPALVQAAQNHADYYLLNYADKTAMAYGPHGEVAGKPKYTGREPWDRDTAAGYPWFAGWEVMHFVNDPVRSVDGWAATIFHRAIMLDPYMEYMGYGYGSVGTARVDVADFGHGMTDSVRQNVVTFPALGQTDVPLQGMLETPSPLPPGETGPFGYPITIQPTAFIPLVVTQAELRDGSGALVSVYPNPSNCGTACYALIPTKLLHAATTYTVHAVGTIDGAPFDMTWSFTTIS
jgi:uncharacterized protein YkwD